jgi:hypothetical protein
MSSNPLQEITQHLDKTDDPILVILRAHLLIEERLRDILARVSRAPEELRTSRLSFYQALFLCRAIIGRQDDPAWGFIARLNDVRNRIAHHLEAGDLDELLGSVVTKLQSDCADQLKTPLGRFRMAVVYACGYLDAFKGSPRLRQAYALEERG